MRPIGTVLAFGIGIAISAGAAAEDDALPLTPPMTGPPPPASSGDSLPPPVEAPAAAKPTSVLAVPGLTRPRAGAVRQDLPPLEPAGPSVVSDFPSLPGPTDPPGAEAQPAPERVIRPAPAERGRPLTLESTPGGVPAGSGSRSPVLRGPAQAPRRPLGLFGRFLPPALSAGRPSVGARDSVTVEPGNDPASDAALKRRIEHQVRQIYGDRLQSVDVRVAGRDVTIHARASRFWQRRALRRSLESLPSLAGLRSTIDVE